MHLLLILERQRGGRRDEVNFVFQANENESVCQARERDDMAIFASGASKNFTGCPPLAGH